MKDYNVTEVFSYMLVLTIKFAVAGRVLRVEVMKFGYIFYICCYAKDSCLILQICYHNEVIIRDTKHPIYASMSHYVRYRTKVYVNARVVILYF